MPVQERKRTGYMPNEANAAAISRIKSSTGIGKGTIIDRALSLGLAQIEGDPLLLLGDLAPDRSAEPVFSAR